jgi:hypothetical protein
MTILENADFVLIKNLINGVEFKFLIRGYGIDATNFVIHYGKFSTKAQSVNHNFHYSDYLCYVAFDEGIVVFIQ